VSPATYTEPNELERELGGELAMLSETSADAKVTATMIADVLAAHRHRCTAFAESVLDGIAAQGVSDHALAMYAHGFTPANVHGLVESYRGMRRQLRDGAALIRNTLAKDPKAVSTFEELLEVRTRLGDALELARSLRGAAPEVTVTELIRTLEG
jgi:hypothetical protein